MKLLLNFLLIFSVIILILVCFICVFSDSDPQNLINSDKLSFDSLIHKITKLDTTLKIKDIQDSLSDLKIPLPNVPFLDQIVGFLNACLRFSVFFFNLLLSLLGFIIGLFNLFFSYFIV